MTAENPQWSSSNTARPKASGRYGADFEEYQCSTSQWEEKDEADWECEFVFGVLSLSKLKRTKFQAQRFFPVSQYFHVLPSASSVCHKARIWSMHDKDHLSPETIDVQTLLVGA